MDDDQMIRPGKMIKQVLESVFKKPATTRYPFVKEAPPKSFRGRIKFYPEKCIGCKMCVRDCPSNAITIIKTPDGRFECEIDLAKCIYCAQCVDSCPKRALEATCEFELASLDRSKLKVKMNAGPAKGTGKPPQTG
jgi:formate hydrogenlyase subunit 6/NADH:ubiquinone oxidoreductase subunit I